MPDNREEDLSQIEEVGKMWYVILIWDIVPPPDTMQKTQRDAIRKEQLRHVSESIIEATGFDWKRSFKIMKKAKTYGCTIVRHNIYEVCERTKAVLTAKGLKCHMFPA